MSEQLLKLSPHRDLQCFFLTPTAIAAMSGASASGYTLSGTWRQQFDWAVVEWDRDNAYEHPSIRYLPDGDLSGLQLTYQETRTGCIPFESNLFPTVDWPSLRLWATGSDGVEHVYFVPLASLATPVTQDYQCASGTMTVQGTPQAGDRVGLTIPVAPAVTGYPEQHYYYQVQSGDSLQSIATGLAANINAGSLDFTATSTGASVTVTWSGYEATSGKTGANGNRITIYGFTSAGATGSWASPTVTLTGGAFPPTYTVSIDFGNLSGYQDVSLTGTWMLVPTTSVRKMRWTWAADLQPGSFARTEYQVVVANWQVTGTDRQWYVAGPGSRRLEDSGSSVAYSGTWLAPTQGNYSGNWIHSTQQTGATATFTYSQNESHSLYLGTQTVPDGATALVTINTAAPQTFNLDTPGEQDLIRISLGVLPAGSYTVTVTHDGPSDGTTRTLYIDFLEIAFPTANLPTPSHDAVLTLATDWDTYHSQAVPAERTAWMIQQLGFGGRVNHYTGALWFYELVMPGHVYASAEVTFTASSSGGSGYTELLIGPESSTVSQLTAIIHYNLPDDTSATVAEAFVCLINSGYTSIWASAAENVLTITSRAMTPITAAPSTTIALSITSGTGNVTASVSSANLTGGVAGTPYDDSTTEQYLTPYTQYWRTDLTTVPRINRAARDWSTAFFAALLSYGIDVVASFSTELLNADPGVSANLAQRQSDGSPILVATPAVQTNFSPASLAYWTQVYLDMAGLQKAAGVVPYLQFGEVQWWYFPSSQLTGIAVSMPFYDSYTTSQFEATYGTSMAIIADEYADPSQFPNEVTLLSTLLGQQTASIRAAVRSQYPDCRLEVLYPVDTNTTPDSNPIPSGEAVHAPSLDELVNYPSSEWTPQNYNSLKTESFTYTYGRNLNESLQAMEFSAQKGFADGSRSHLIGISDNTAPWVREVDLARSQGMESIVLFALDQFCLIGYPAPSLPQGRSLRQA
jgi:hypothetical protein